MKLFLGTSWRQAWTRPCFYGDWTVGRSAVSATSSGTWPQRPHGALRGRFSFTFSFTITRLFLLPRRRPRRESLITVTVSVKIHLLWNRPNRPHFLIILCDRIWIRIKKSLWMTAIRKIKRLIYIFLIWWINMWKPLRGRFKARDRAMPRWTTCLSKSWLVPSQIHLDAFKLISAGSCVKNR